MYAGVEMGREYPPWLSVVFLTRGARAVAAPTGTLKCDISNAAFECAVKLGTEHSVDTDWIQRYNKYKEEWRDVAKAYYGISANDAKQHFQPSLYTSPYPPRGKRCLGVLPFVACLAAQAQRVRAAACDSNPGLVEAPPVANLMLFYGLLSCAFVCCGEHADYIIAGFELCISLHL